MAQYLVIDAPFLHKPSNRKVMAALNLKAPNCARFVGGCVRDAILGRKSTDIDIATWLLPEEIIGALDAAGIKWVPTGIDHGTISAIIENRAVEITTLRRDIQTDGRRAEIAFTNDWLQDAMRRDFTCNSLYCDIEGRVFEPIAGAIDDCQNGRIRFVGDAQMRVQEDYLRILRFFRFYAWFGKGEIDKTGLAACAKFKSKLNQLSRERIWAELTKLLSAPNPAISIKHMAHIGVLNELMGFDAKIEVLEKLIALENDLAVPLGSMLRFMALLEPGCEVSSIAIRFRISNHEKQRLVAWQNLRALFDENTTASNAKANIYYHGKAACIDAILLTWAKNGASAFGNWQTNWEIVNNFTAPIFPINGNDLKQAGIKEGPELGKIFKDLEAYWVSHNFEPTKNELMARV